VSDPSLRNSNGWANFVKQWQAQGDRRGEHLAERTRLKSMKLQPENEQRSDIPPEISPVPDTIVCGTDFSEESARAAQVASLFANRLRQPLILVHAANQQEQQNLPGNLRDSLALYARAQLHDERDRLRALQVEAIETFREGAPDAALLEEAAIHHARLIVLAAAKRRPIFRRLLGSVAERVAEAAGTPTLVVRDAAPLLRWGQGQRRLRIFVAADFSPPSEAALRWVDWFRHLGPCDIVVAYLDPGLAPFPVADLYPSLLVDNMALQPARMQERHFRQWVRALLGQSRVRVRIESNWARADAHLIRLASEERADLIVIGTHSRSGWHRLGHHSVSRGVLHYAPLNVVCVPANDPLQTATAFFRYR
jgi:nucleotide-binding universal stress UspA family protein